MALNEKSEDQQRHWNSSSGDDEYLYEILVTNSSDSCRDNSVRTKVVEHLQRSLQSAKVITLLIFRLLIQS